MKPATFGPLYALGIYPKLAEFFRCRGYALAVHGSLGADFDLIAVPWVDEAWAPDHVIGDMVRKFALKPYQYVSGGRKRQTKKPHGRVAYKFHVSFADCALDISFTPRRRLR